MIYVIYSVLPKEIGSLPCLTKLDISANSICFIPIVFMRLTSLEYFNFSDNKIELFPYSLGYLPSLRVLYCKNNPFQNIDPSIVSNSSSLINALHQYLIEHPDEYSLEISKYYNHNVHDIGGFATILLPINNYIGFDVDFAYTRHTYFNISAGIILILPLK